MHFPRWYSGRRLGRYPCDPRDRHRGAKPNCPKWFQSFHHVEELLGLFNGNIAKPCNMMQMVANPSIQLTYPHYVSLNSSPPGQNGCQFADDLFRCIFVNEKFCILIKFSLKFVPKGPIDNIPALVQVMAWRRIGDHYLNQCWPDPLQIYAALGRDELKPGLCICL